MHHHHHHHHRRFNIIRRIKEFFARRKRNAYLEQHWYYESFTTNGYQQDFHILPYMPYSLYDVLSGKNISNKNILVIDHHSTAHWFERTQNTVTLARLQHYGGHYSRIRRIESYQKYEGEPIDILVWDCHIAPPDWESFIASHLSPQGVVIITYSHYFDAMDLGFGQLGEHLMSKGMRVLTFKNPGPQRELMTAELYYPRDNVLDI